MSRQALWWLVFGLFAAHNAEEVLAGPPFPAQAAWLLAPSLHVLAQSLSARALVAGAVCITGAALVLTAWASKRPLGSPACWWMLLLQSVILLNAGMHLILSATTGHYTPGLITALAFNLPASLYHFRRAWRESWLRPIVSLALAPVALLLHGPVLIGLLAILQHLT